MRLSTVVLTRANQQTIVQGMIHIGPQSLYQKLQQRLDEAIAGNYQIFFEGVRRKYYRCGTANELRIKKFFHIMFSSYPVFAVAIGVAEQRDEIVYPKDGVNADIDTQEMTRVLDENGFKCRCLLFLFEILRSPKFKSQLAEVLAQKKSTYLIQEQKNPKLLSRLIIWTLFRKANPVILGYRNHIAVAQIKKSSDGRNIFLHYGEKHISGLVRLFQGEGWIVKEISYTELADFC